ncbi:MAG TPA: DUF1990 family protein [Solirubrobacteraceae bacterium]|nr:DUF1990 family protein [Solirubrobacteraceae bacterium]
MPRRPKPTARWLLALTWPTGIALTSWDYMWRTTVMHRRETVRDATAGHLPPAYPDGVDDTEVQHPNEGAGPLFHRRYRTRIRDAHLSASDLVAQLKTDLNQAAPTKFARFQRVLGDDERLRLGDEYVVRMPGPWDGPVRVIADDERSFRLATLAGHLEAGQIEFRARPDDDTIAFEIESWARSGDRLSNLLYHKVRMAKEVQLHMWTSFLEGVTALAGGRISGGIDIDTHRVENPFGAPE